jgi:surface polysaccharide O-acyltransferase-like enzyme
MDVIRALAIIAVVLIHVTATILYRVNMNTSTYDINMAINQVSRFSVPMFILISGLGLSISNKKNEGYFKFIIHRFYKILPKYIIWCLIYVYFTTKNFEIHTLVDGMVYGNIFYHLYYIPIIMELYLIFPFVYKFIGSKWCLFITFLINMVILIYSYYYKMSPDMQWFLDKKDFLNWIFYFSLGAFIAENLENFRDKCRKYKGIIFVLFFLSTYFIIHEAIITSIVSKNIDYAATFQRPSILIYTILLTAVVFAVDIKSIVLLKFIAKNSYDVYLSHALILYYYTQYCTSRGISINDFHFLAKAFIVTFFGSILINIVKRLF